MKLLLTNAGTDHHARQLKFRYPEGEGGGGGCLMCVMSGNVCPWGWGLEYGSRGSLPFYICLFFQKELRCKMLLL